MIYTKNKPMPFLIKSAVSTAKTISTNVINIVPFLSNVKPRTGKVSSINLWITNTITILTRQPLKGT